jgi:hypothetical protein
MQRVTVICCHKQVQYSALIAACDAAGNSAMVLHTVEAALSDGHTLDSITLVQLMKAVRALGVASTWQTVHSILQYTLHSNLGDTLCLCYA